MPTRVSTGDRDAVLRQIRWCAAVQTLVNCHYKLEEDPVRHVEPVQLVVQYLTQAVFSVFHSSEVGYMKTSIGWKSKELGARRSRIHA